MSKPSPAGSNQGASERIDCEDMVEDGERKMILCAVISELLAGGESWEKDLLLPFPGVWRRPECYERKELSVSWSRIGDPVSSGFDRLDLRVFMGQEKPAVLTASFRAATGEVLSVLFKEPNLGNLLLLYDKGRLTREDHWSRLKTDDPWKEGLGRGSLDRFLNDFCRAVGFSCSRKLP